MRRETTVVATLLLAGLAASAAAAAAPAFSEREVRFANGSVELRGTLMLPATSGRHPAVVFLHGSGPHAREGFRPYAEELARLGLASLFFDKRGSGASGGSWTTSSLDDLAGDALAAVAHLMGLQEIDPARIGFWGVSQAGWVAPLAASRSQDIAFMVLISGGGVTPRESELFSYEQQFERAGLSAAEKAEAREVLDAYFAYLASGEGRPELVARLEALAGTTLEPLGQQLGRILPSQENRANWSWVATWDPAPHIARITCPVLLLFGDRDREQPTAAAARAWREGLAKAGNDQVTLMIFPGAGHGIRLPGQGGHSGRAPFADGYVEAQLGWLWRHVVAGS